MRDVVASLLKRLIRSREGRLPRPTASDDPGLRAAAHRLRAMVTLADVAALGLGGLDEPRARVVARCVRARGRCRVRCVRER